MKSHRIPNQSVSQFSRTVSGENGYRKYEDEVLRSLTLKDGDLDVVKRAWANFNKDYKIGDGK